MAYSDKVYSRFITNKESEELGLLALKYTNSFQFH